MLVRQISGETEVYLEKTVGKAWSSPSYVDSGNASGREASVVAMLLYEASADEAVAASLTHLE